jgi:hypothetical protein
MVRGYFFLITSHEQETARLRREIAHLEGKASPPSNRAPAPNVGLGSGMFFPQLTPGVREGKPMPGTQPPPHEPYPNNGGYVDVSLSQGAKRGRPEDQYNPSRGNGCITQSNLRTPTPRHQ